MVRLIGDLAAERDEKETESSPHSSSARQPASDMSTPIRMPIPKRRGSGAENNDEHSNASSMTSASGASSSVSVSLSASDLAPPSVSRSPFAFALSSPSLPSSSVGLISSPFVASSVGGSPVAVRLEQLLSQEDELAAAEAADQFQPLPPSAPITMTRANSSHNLANRKRENTSEWEAHHW